MLFPLFLMACQTSPTEPTVGPEDPTTPAQPYELDDPVTLTVDLDSFDSSSEATVFVHDVDGSFVRTVSTDAEGYAEIEDMLPGGSVTVGVRTKRDRFLLTTQDVVGGDALRLANTEYEQGVRTTVLHDVLDVPGADRYRVLAGCTSRSADAAGGEESFVVPLSCVGEHVVGTLLALGPVDQVIATLSAEVAATEGAVVDLRGLQWRQALPATEILVSNPPFDGSMTVNVTSFRDGAVLGSDSAYLQLDVGGAAFASVPTFARADRRSVRVEHHSGYPDLLSRSATFDVDPSAEGVFVDLADVLLGSAPSGTFVPPDEISIAGQAPGACGPAGSADISVWFAGLYSKKGPYHGWIIADLPDATEVYLPDLGPTAGEWWPSETLPAHPVGLTVVADAEEDYDTLRTHWMELAFFDRSIGTHRCIVQSGGI